jgi:hypothetical protein
MEQKLLCGLAVLDVVQLYPYTNYFTLTLTVQKHRYDKSAMDLNLYCRLKIQTDLWSFELVNHLLCLHATKYRLGFNLDYTSTVILETESDVLSR